MGWVLDAGRDSKDMSGVGDKDMGEIGCTVWETFTIDSNNT
jgi:hypothetical protein